MERNYYFTKAERSLGYADFNCKYWFSGGYFEHTHVDYYEIILPTGETFVNTVDGKDIRLSKYQALIIPPGISHVIRTIGSGKAPHHNLTVKEERFENFIRAKKHLKKALECGEPYLIDLSEATFNALSELLYSINNDCYDERFLLLAETALNLIACASLLDSEDNGYAENTVTAYCKDAIGKIDSYAFVSASVSDVYREYPVSGSTFCAEFKRLTGKTPRDYLSENRMEYAKNLVLTTSLTMLEIAELLGFESGSHFIRKFTKAYGTSPLRYRKGGRGDSKT